MSAPSFAPIAFTRARLSVSLWNSRTRRSSACAANSWLCEKIAAELPPVSSEVRQVSREPRRDSAATMRCAVPGTRRERVETAGREGASGRRRSAPAGRDFTKSLSRACTALATARVSTCRSIRVTPAWPAARARSSPRSCAAKESAGAMPAARAPGHRGERAVLRRLREARQVLGGVFDDVETQAIEASESHQQERGARVACICAAGCAVSASRGRHRRSPPGAAASRR